MKPNLEMQVNKTPVGLWTVTYGCKEAPLDVQELAFAANDLHLISPAEHGFLRVNEGKGTFKPYSRENADVFYDDRNTQVVIIPNGAISKHVGVANLVDAHRQGREYIIPKNQRESVYVMVDEMLKNSIAFVAPHGQTRVLTSEFGKQDLTLKLFSDERLGIEAQKYGDWLLSQKRDANTFFVDSKDYSRTQRAPYLNRLRVFGPGSDFDVNGSYGDLDYDSGAFGVRFEKTAEGGPKK